MRVRIARHHNGIGDWLMLLAALRWLRAQHPDVVLTIDFRNAPRIVQDAFAASDLSFEDARHAPALAHVSIPHLVYDFGSGEPYLEGMTRALAAAVGRPIALDLADLPFRGTPLSPQPHALAIVGHGKGVTIGGKEWGRENFFELSMLLRGRDYLLRQVGGSRDFPIPGVGQYLGVSWVALLGLLAGSRAFIGVENGLMVLALFLGVPTVTFYNGARADRVTFGREHLRLGDPITPEAALERIEAWLG